MRYLWQAILVVLVGGALSAANAQTLERTRLPDGSGSIGLPSGWRITASINSMVSAEGPEGSADLGLWTPMTTPEAAAAWPMRPPAVSEYGDPGQAVIDLAVSTGLAAPGSVKILERSRLNWWNNGPAESLVTDSVAADRKCFAIALEAPLGDGQFFLYYSLVCAPREKFDDNLPLLLRVWSSWHTDDWVYQERLREAALSLHCVERTIRRMGRAEQRSSDRTARMWDEYIRQ